MLDDFISKQRIRFDTKDNNLFATSWGKVSRRLEFLKIIMYRYTKLSIECVQSHEELRAALSGKSGTYTQLQQKLYNDTRSIGAQVHLQIESAYLFAKIILDDIARAIEYYFGTVAGCSLDSHNDWEKGIDKYIGIKKHIMDPELRAKISELKKKISDYRDYQIAHEKSPRTVFGTTLDKVGGIKIVTSRIYPKESEYAGEESVTPNEIFESVESYVEMIVSFIVANQDLTGRKRKIK